MDPTTRERLVEVNTGSVSLEGNLNVPGEATGVVLFAHGSGSSRHSSRNRFVADVLQDHALATLLMDLLTSDEEDVDRRTGHLRFDIPLLATRLQGAVKWLQSHPDTRRLPIGLFGASTGAAAALITAARLGDSVRAVVSRGGRPDLAGDQLGDVEAPTLLIVGGRDHPVIEMNEDAKSRLRAPTTLEIVPEATHLFEEPGALEKVAEMAADWFVRHLTASVSDGDAGMATEELARYRR